MTRGAAVRLRWVDEELETPTGTRTVRVAWLVHDDPGAEGPRYLAYLGDRPFVTPHLIEEVHSLYPEIEVDWDAVRAEIAGETGHANVAALTDDELAQRLRALAAERDLSLTDLSLRLGYRQRNVLAEVMRFLDDPLAVARFERTAGGIFAYLDSRHPEYAFLLYKARLLFEGDDEGLRRSIREEPRGFGGAVARERREFWRRTLDAYRQSRRSPSDVPEESSGDPENDEGG